MKKIMLKPHLNLILFLGMTLVIGTYHSIASAAPSDALYKPATFLDKALAQNYGFSAQRSFTTSENNIYLGKLAISWVSKNSADCSVKIEKVNKYNFYLNMLNCYEGLAHVTTDSPSGATICIWQAKNDPTIFFTTNVSLGRVSSSFRITSAFMNANNYYQLICE